MLGLGQGQGLGHGAQAQGKGMGKDTGQVYKITHSRRRAKRGGGYIYIYISIYIYIYIRISTEVLRGRPSAVDARRCQAADSASSAPLNHLQRSMTLPRCPQDGHKTRSRHVQDGPRCLQHDMRGLRELPRGL